MMNAEQRYLFDLQGFLHLPDVIPPAAVAAMNAWIDDQSRDDPKWLGQKENRHVDYPITWNRMFTNLVDNETVLPILSAILGERFRLDEDYAIFLQPGHEGLPLHGPNGAPFDPCHYYHSVGGQIYCGLTSVVYSLTDVPQGSGGFACIPGSHKSNFHRGGPLGTGAGSMKEFSSLAWDSPLIKHVPVHAGDCILFTESLIHGTAPWRGPGPRRTLFYKYAPGNLTWSKHKYFPAPPIEDVSKIAGELSEIQKRLLAPPSADDHRDPILSSPPEQKTIV